jgi:chemotaxis protein CheY-P-specific phosphatase CheC
MIKLVHVQVEISLDKVQVVHLHIVRKELAVPHQLVAHHLIVAAAVVVEMLAVLSEKAAERRSRKRAGSHCVMISKIWQHHHLVAQ